MIRTLALVFSLLFFSTVQSHPREMFLAGGALHICSSLALSDCKGTPEAFIGARSAPRYRINDLGMARALSAPLWPQAEHAPTTDSVRALLQAAARKVGRRELDGDALFNIFDDLCAGRGPTRLRACSNEKGRRPWREMLDSERSAIVAAFEIPSVDGTNRRREAASLDHSKRPEGVAILRAFVAAAALRSKGRKPLIAVVTASANDTFDPVDFYLSALREAGAEPVWWPLDATLAAALHGGKGCAALADLRLHKLALPAREIVFPDLVAAQLKACENPEALLGMVDRMQGVFFSGGDQWRLRQAFFDDKDRPNAWLKKLRLAYTRGDIVIGGTSAGTAVQSAMAMLSNGETQSALAHGAIAAPPPTPGCMRAQRCPKAINESDMTYWPRGGLALEPGWVFDTHFSERARELRLLQLVHDSGVRWAIGVDETSALHLRSTEKGIQIETLGASGAWIFDNDPKLQSSSKIRARAHYVAPGAQLEWVDQQWTLLGEPRKPALIREIPTTPTDALEGGALRALAAQLGSSEVPSNRASALQGEVCLLRTAFTRSWLGPAGQVGVSDIIIEYTPSSQANEP